MDAGAMGLWHAVQFYDHHKLRDEYSYAAWPDVRIIFSFEHFLIEIFFWLIFFADIETARRHRVLLRLVVHSGLDWHQSTFGCFHHVFVCSSLHPKWETIGTNQKHAVFDASISRQTKSVWIKLRLCIPRPLYLPRISVRNRAIRLLKLCFLTKTKKNFL